MATEILFEQTQTNPLWEKVISMSISDLLAVYIVRNFEHLFSQEDWNNSKMCSSEGIQLEETDLFRAPGLFGPWNADDDGNDDKDDGDDYDDDDDDDVYQVSSLLRVQAVQSTGSGPARSGWLWWYIYVTANMDNQLV